MKKILMLLVLFCGWAQAQQIEFLEKNDTLQKPKWQEFVYISETTDVSQSVYVAKIKAIGSLKKPSDLFLKIKTEAQKIGANSFKFENFNKIDAQNGELILSVYYNESDFFDFNFEQLPKDRIFIFGNEDLTETKRQGYRLDGKKQEIQNGKYQVYDIVPGQETKINKGGFTGETIWINQNAQRYSSFISFSGVGFGSMAYAPAGGIGVSMNTGNINRVEPNLALTLLKIFSKQE